MGLSDSLPGRSHGYGFPRRVVGFRFRSTGPPRLLGRSFHARCPQPPRKVQWLLAPVASPPVCLASSKSGGLATFVFLSRPNRVHLHYGSRARLASPPAPLLELTLARLRAEQAIYTVNSFHFTRSARLILTYPTNGRRRQGCCPGAPFPSSQLHFRNGRNLSRARGLCAACEPLTDCFRSGTWSPRERGAGGFRGSPHKR